MKYKAVLFDMDGTILDTLGDLTDAVNTALKKFGYPLISKTECAKNLGNGARHLISKSMPENADNIEEVLNYYIPYYNTHCLINTCPYDGIMPLMNTLKENGIKMAVISNKPNEAAVELSNIFFKDIVDYTVGESETVKRKPNPDAVLAAVERFGLKIDDCVYIGDTEVDIITAQNAGMDCIAVEWGFRSREELLKSGATVLAKDCREILERLS